MMRRLEKNNMAHRVDVDSIHRNIFILLNICYAAENFGRNHDLSTYEETDPINGPYYVGWLKFTLSEKLIDIAIKTRILLDIVRSEEVRYRKTGEEYFINSYSLDKEVVGQYNIGAFIGSGEELTIRESCNKIIHAADIRPLLERGDGDHALDEESVIKREWLYWNGAVDLKGSKGKEEWEVTLHVPDFCQALDLFVTRIETELDWSSIHYDLDVF